MEKMRKQIIKILFLATVLVSCGKEQFAPIKENNSTTSPTIHVSSSLSCSSFTYIKPKVDFLILWDNSTSSIFIDNTTLNALANLLTNISSQFDFHVMVAPLKDNGNSEERIAVSTPTGLNASALGKTIPLSSIPSTILGFTRVAGNQEAGVSRSVSLINNNRSNGVFRDGAYLNIVTVSNQDDNSWIVNYPPTAIERDAYVANQLHDLLCLRGNYVPPAGKNCTGVTPLTSQQMRFMSVVAYADPSFQTCGNLNYWSKNHVYKEISSKVYSYPYSNGVILSDQNTRSDLENSSGFYNYDSYDLCSQSSFAHLFDGINASIQATLLPHKYNYWPVASSGVTLDPNEVQVSKNGSPLTRLTPPVLAGQNGFTFDNISQTVNTRFEPTVGEPFTGYVVQLHGSAVVAYPDCINVTTQTPAEYFGYIPLDSKPYESTIVVKINDVTIPKSATNGWQLIKDGNIPRFYSSKNIKIKTDFSKCPTANEPDGYCPETPAVNRSGYMIQVHGTAIYSNGAKIQVIYDPAS